MYPDCRNCQLTYRRATSATSGCSGLNRRAAKVMGAQTTSRMDMNGVPILTLDHRGESDDRLGRREALQGGGGVKIGIGFAAAVDRCRKAFAARDCLQEAMFAGTQAMELQLQPMPHDDESVFSAAQVDRRRFGLATDVGFPDGKGGVSRLEQTQRRIQLEAQAVVGGGRYPGEGCQIERRMLRREQRFLDEPLQPRHFGEVREAIVGMQLRQVI